MNKHFCFASVISEIQQSDMFMTVKARIFETPKANLNGVRVTPAFLSEIVENEERYVGLPLYADVRALKSGNYNRLGHLYDTRTGEFHSTQIGSFYQFEQEDFDGGSYLIGYARIPKRDKKISKAIAELFADESLKFSFEIACGDCEEQEDGTTLIDVSENNYLEGTAIVTFPACEDAVALEFVAQRQADDSERGETEMAEVETKAEVLETEAEAVETEVAEVEASETAENEEAACKDKKKAEEEETSEENKETAAVVIHECHQEINSVCAYDTESGADVHQTVSVETCVSHVEPDAQIVEDIDGVKIAEGDETPGESTPAAGDGNQNGTSETGGSGNGDSGSGTGGASESGGSGTGGTGGSGGSGSGGAGGSGGSGSAPATNTVEDLPVVEDEKKKTAEQLIAELTEVVSTLKSEIEELKASKSTLTASAEVAELNPFIGSINSEKKYSLLEKAEKADNFSLLEKA